MNGVPGAQTVNEDTNLVFTGANAITISDVDAGSGDATVTLTVTGGTLALGSTLNLTSFTNNAASITLTGTIANINAALNGLTYHGNLNFNGPDSLSIVTHDNGNTGGGDLTDTDSVTINVTAVNDAPTATNLTQSLILGEDAAATALFTLAPVVSDVDSAAVTATLTLDAAAGVLTGAGVGVLNAGVLTYTITGTPAAVSTALAGVAFRFRPRFQRHYRRRHHHRRRRQWAAGLQPDRHRHRDHQRGQRRTDRDQPDAVAQRRRGWRGSHAVHAGTCRGRRRQFERDRDADAGCGGGRTDWRWSRRVERGRPDLHHHRNCGGGEYRAGGRDL